MAASPKTSILIVPTFSLFRVDPEKVARDYQNGVYSDIKVPNPSSIKAIKEIFNPVYDSESGHSIYSFRDKSNNETVIATTNCNNYKIEKLDGVTSTCLYCRRDFSHHYIGIPVHKDSCYNDVGEMIVTFHVEGNFCTYSCALAHIDIFIDRYSVRYPDSRSNLFALYNLNYPSGPKLRPANDFLLLKRNGGSLTDEEWSKEDFRYTEITGIIVSPCKLMFMRGYVKPSKSI